MKNTATKLLIPALAICLSLVPLAACSGQQAQSSSSAQSSQSAQSTQAAAEDYSSWTTLGDAIAFGGEPLTASWNDEYYVGLFENETAMVRVVANAKSDTDEKIMSYIPGSENAAKQMAAAVGDLTLVSVEDVTSQAVPQEALDALAGKTGQDLLDDGWKFAGYFMTGGKETTATMDNGLFAYDVTFDTKVSEKAAGKDSDGDLIKAAKVKSVEANGASEDTVNPSLVGQEQAK